MKRPLNLIVCLLVPIIILLCGLFLGVTYAYREIPRLTIEIGRGMIPNGFDVLVEQPGSYIVWLHTYAHYEGEAYEHNDKLPSGGRVLLFNKQNGERIELTQWVTQARPSLNSEKAISLGSFQTYSQNQVIEVKASGVSRPAVVSLSPRKMGDLMRLGMHLLGILCLTLFLSITALIVLLHRRQKQLQQEGAI